MTDMHARFGEQVKRLPPQNRDLYKNEYSAAVLTDSAGIYKPIRSFRIF